MKNILWIFITMLFFSCAPKNGKFDAQGVFESDEVMVSSEVPGKILAFEISEGDSLIQNQIVAQVDSNNLLLQRAQLRSSLNALNQKMVDVAPQIELLKNQIEVQNTQLKNLHFEKNRIEQLLKSDAATQKQLDDLLFQIESVQKQVNVTKQQIKVQESTIGTQNRAVLSEEDPMQRRIDQVQDLINKSTVTNPINGVVLTTYVEQGEMIGVGKPLYKIADLSIMTLRVYVTGDQLANIKIGQLVKVFVDKNKDEYTELAGKISAIASKAEFTPKTIQTKDERANLVYAVKILVKNDGLLKIGMYGEVKF
ncbi:HlyD family secretion protein [Sediminibacterium sp.]|uniref:HlyD family secretion protein n=1 Tax=Sediminibacterium sp. TaxID=1917865 RepID=UPI00273594EA|nr:HlyD family efflux transporter periplasmic adaptor subunit [Sediminibacterium sp.]MDP3392983.1 efflux RND transporter periplasmic adaptor subunit [Sediminibacterium sp.]MDP3567189.1 efflux RND transporter periplasmic adaptor subunit [Sediminibacterium sp.]